MPERPMENRRVSTRQELVFALIGPAGVRLDDLSRALTQQLAAFQYNVSEIRLSDLLKNFKGWTNESPVEKYVEYARIIHRQRMALEFRRATKDASALARAGIAAT